MDKKEAFACVRCGKSCRLRVKLTPADTRMLLKAPYVKKLGLKTLDIAEPDVFRHAGKGDVLRQEERVCIFFSRDSSGKGVCNVYEHRPQICRDFPFVGGQTMPCTALGDDLG